MPDEHSEIAESARAVQEVARTTGKVVDLTREFGSFFSKFFGGSLEEGMGIFEDKLKYYRWERQLRFMVRAKEKMASLGLTGPNQPMPLKLAIPLLEAASIEDDDYLQDKWANLLANFCASTDEFELSRTHIDILERLSPLEARILDVVYAFLMADLGGRAVATGELPERAVLLEKDEDRADKPKKEVEFALANLSRLGCLGLPTTWGGGQIFSAVYPAVLGWSLVEACRSNVDTR